jgi:hypothetical protein
MICYSLAVYQRLTSGPAYSPITQDILSHAVPACRLGEGAMPHCDRSGLRRKKSPSSAWIYFRDADLASAFVAVMSGVLGARSRLLAGKTSRRWVPYCGLTPPCFFGHGCGPEPRQPTIDAGEPAEPQRRQRKHGSFHHPGVPF